jgi:hypothetical protein
MSSNSPEDKRALKDAGRISSIDWLRGLVIAGILVVHCCMVFGSMGWNIQSGDNIFAFNMVSGSLQTFSLPVLCFLAGASVYLALRKMGTRAFTASRAKRLLVPWALGVMVLSPVQLYFERISQGVFNGGFLEFLPHYFDGFYGFGGNFAWMGNHLWFLLALFIGSMLLLPLFKRRGSGPGLLERAANRLNGAWLLALMFLASALALSFIPPDIIVGSLVTGSWNLAALLPFFIAGYMFYANPAALETFRKIGPRSLLAAVVLTAWLNFWLASSLAGASSRPLYESPFLGLGHTYRDPLYPASGALFVATGCMWLTGLWWLCDRFLNRPGRAADYTRELTMPFYILHQPVVIILAYWFSRGDLPVALRFIFLLVTAALSCTVLYEFGIRRFPVVRVLFGLAARKPGGKSRG